MNVVFNVAFLTADLAFAITWVNTGSEFAPWGSMLLCAFAGMHFVMAMTYAVSLRR